MPTGDATFVVVATPPGRGAVATVVIDGPRALGLTDELLSTRRRGAVSDEPPGAVAVGRWNSPTGDEVVAAVRSDRRVEIHCHGGAAACRAIVQSLTEHGCQSVPWQTWLSSARPTWCGSEPGDAEAAIALADARTERTAAILLDQYHGALRRAVRGILHAIDSPQPHHAAEQIEVLLDRARVGVHLEKPWRIVLAGPPNVGKSSLLNALLGFQRAIVSRRTGTTRDVVTAPTAFDGWPVALSDTAGLGTSADPVEAAGIRKAAGQLEAADLVILVFDVQVPWSAGEQEVVDAWPGAMIAHNKCDLTEDRSAKRPDGLRVSALKGTGINDLVEQAARRLVPQPPPPQSAVPFMAAQVERLRQAAAAISQRRIDSARQALRPLCGEVADTSR